MEKLFLILLIALTTCSAIEESFDDNLVLEISKGKEIVPPKVRHTTRDTIRITTRLTSKVKNVRNLPIKGFNDILKGKSGEEFWKQDIVKDRNSRLEPPRNGFRIKSRNPGQRYPKRKNGE